MNPKTKKTLKITSASIGAFIGAVVLTVCFYATYVLAQFYRIPDKKPLEVKQNSEISQIEINKELTFTTFNVGYGAYSPEYSFFLSKGIDEDGTVLKGKDSKGFSKEEVFKNITGSVNFSKTLNSDFYAIQEVDKDSDRAYHIDEVKLFEDMMPSYSSTYAENFHSAYLLYPVFNPFGQSNSGLVTLSKYKLNDPIRNSLKISDKFDKLFDLDRCFSSHYIEVNNGKKLCLINIHMSAYDEGGVIRNEQAKQITKYINNEYDLGNYVIAAGDYNHDLLTNNPMYKFDENNRAFSSEYKQKVPHFVSNIFNENKESPFGEHFKIYADDKNPTMRGGDRGYKKGYTYMNTFDGFIVSDNVEFVKVEASNLANDKVDKFAYSDHQPTTLTFKLKTLETKK